MSSNEFLLDGASRHAVLLQRYSAGLESSFANNVSRAIDEIIRGLAGEDSTTLTARRIGSLRVQLVSDYTDSLTESEEELLRQLLELSESEGDFSAELFTQGTSQVARPPVQLSLFTAVRNTVLELEGQNITIPKMLTGFTKAKTAQVSSILSSGFSEGKTQQELIKEVRAVKPLQRRQAASLVRTGTNSVSSIARYQTMKENKSIFDGYEWVSTLDSRTSHICMARDGVVYKFAKSSPKPPAHWSACPENTMITTKRGSVPIQDVKVGDLVMTHAGRWKPVTCVMAKPHKGAIKTLVDDFGNRLSLTDEHPVLTEAGYVGAINLDSGHKVFNYRNKLSNLKFWLLGALVKDRILVDSHNLQTETTERLVAYTVTSFAAGMSSSVNLNNDVSDNEVANVTANNFLKLISYAKLIKNVFYKAFVKCGIFK